MLNTNLAPHMGAVTHRVTAVLINDDPVRESFIVGLYVQSSVSPVQGILLDKVNIIYSCNLREITRDWSGTPLLWVDIIAKAISTSDYLFQQSWCIYIQFTTSFNDMYSSILTLEFIYSVTSYKHWDERTGREPFFICLQDRERKNKSLKKKIGSLVGFSLLYL